MRPDPMPVRVRGVVYPSAAAAAKALRIPISTVRSAVVSNRADELAAPRVRYSPIYLGPYKFKTTVQIAAKIDRSPETVSRALRTRRGRARLLRMLEEAAHD